MPTPITSAPRNFRPSSPITDLRIGRIIMICSILGVLGFFKACSISTPSAKENTVGHSSEAIYYLQSYLLDKDPKLGVLDDVGTLDFIANAKTLKPDMFQKSSAQTTTTTSTTSVADETTTTTTSKAATKTVLNLAWKSVKIDSTDPARIVEIHRILNLDTLDVWSIPLYVVDGKTFLASAPSPVPHSSSGTLKSPVKQLTLPAKWSDTAAKQRAADWASAWLSGDKRALVEVSGNRNDVFGGWVLVNIVDVHPTAVIKNNVVKAVVTFDAVKDTDANRKIVQAAQEADEATSVNIPVKEMSYLLEFSKLDSKLMTIATWSPSEGM